MKTWKKLILLILPLAAAALCFLPNGVKMVFADPDGVYITYTAYCDMLPFGYGNFAPLLTLVLTVVIAVLAAVGIKKNNLRAVNILSAVTFVVSMFPIAFGAYTVIGGCISVLIAAEYIISAAAVHKEKFAK